MPKIFNKILNNNQSNKLQKRELWNKNRSQNRSRNNSQWLQNNKMNTLVISTNSQLKTNLLLCRIDQVQLKGVSLIIKKEESSSNNLRL